MGQFGQIGFPIENYKTCGDLNRIARKSA